MTMDVLHLFLMWIEHKVGPIYICTDTRNFLKNIYLFYS